MTTKNPVAKIDDLAGSFLKESGKSLENYAIREYDKNAFLKSAMIAIVDNAGLSKAIGTPGGKKSLFSALRYAASTGLSLNPMEGKACLIPYGEKIQYQVMKNGMIDLALESGTVEFITSDYVKVNDKFELKKTVDGDNYDFQPALKDRGPLLGFFAAIKLKSGSTSVKWMTLEEINEHRKLYSSKTQMPEVGYGIKTVLKALLRNISISKELTAAVSADDFYEADFTVDEPGVSGDEAAEKLKTKTDAENTTTEGNLL